MANESALACKYCDLALSDHTTFQLRLCLADYQRKENVQRLIRESIAETERERRALMNQLTTNK